jgi:ATP-binding cassette subfamily C protein CydC
VRHADDAGRTRSALRTELVTAVDAWTEMASMGAADQLAQCTLRHLVKFEDRRHREAATRANATSIARAVTAATLVLAVVSASSSGADVATLVFIALLAGGVLQGAERLVAAAHVRRVASQADERLRSVAYERPIRLAGGPRFRAAYDRHGLRVSGYWLPETPTRRGREIQLVVAPGQTLVITGASGAGKTTLLDAIATAPR